MFDSNQFYSPSEIAKKLHVTPAYIRQLICTGKLKAKNLSVGKKRPTYRSQGIWLNQYFALDEAKNDSIQQDVRPSKTFV